MSTSPTVSSTWAERPEWGPCPAGGVVSEDAPGTTITIPPVSDTSLIDPGVLANVLSAALAHGGDMAEVFAEEATTASTSEHAPVTPLFLALSLQKNHEWPPASHAMISTPVGQSLMVQPALGPSAAFRHSASVCGSYMYPSTTRFGHASSGA